MCHICCVYSEQRIVLSLTESSFKSCSDWKMYLFIFIFLLVVRSIFSRLITIFPCLFCVYLHLLWTSQRERKSPKTYRRHACKSWTIGKAKTEPVRKRQCNRSSSSTWRTHIRFVHRALDSHIRWDKFKVFHYNDEKLYWTDKRKKYTSNEWRAAYEWDELATLLHKTRTQCHKASAQLFLLLPIAFVSFIFLVRSKWAS